ncbi:hypothetical protein PAV_9c01370 [Paenibacillus alvei DSM 29]|uniref:hypothetical protein n=1 Tax=Paenibacillus alvei TaxID=44250 RepID=UPI00028A0578|nr:hypothetical protein [Paenibacillus alvei]EJW15214.1 hypothetical protein PAV_9c01370 [Paenibacillus alvei DSM 29]
MKRKIIAGIASLLLVGGAVGAAAAAGTANGSMKDPSHGSRQLLTSKQAEEIALRQVKGDVRSVELKKRTAGCYLRSKSERQAVRMTTK